MTAQRSKRILIAEDDASAREVIGMLLSQAGHEITAVADGDALGKALDVAQRDGTPFDLLVSDVRMPGEGAFSVLRRSHRPRTILLTAYPEDWVFFNAYQLDCLCVIAKPFDVSELRRIVSLVLSDTTARPLRPQSS